MRAELIDFGVEPDVVVCSSPGDPRRTVLLTVHATNRGAEPVACRLVSISIVLGTGGAALTADPWTIRPAPGRVTPWQVGVSGDGRWDCFPLPPTTGLDPGQRASFELSGIVVNEVPGVTTVSIEEFHGAESRSVKLQVRKLGAPAPAADDPDAGTEPDPRPF